MAITQQVAEGLAVVLDVGRAYETVEDTLLHLGGHLVREGSGSGLGLGLGLGLEVRKDTVSS